MFVDLNTAEPVAQAQVHKHPQLSLHFIYVDGVPYTIHRMQQCAHVWQAVGEPVGVLHRCTKWQEAGFTGGVYCSEHLEYIKRRESNQKNNAAQEALKNLEVNFDELF